MRNKNKKGETIKEVPNSSKEESVLIKQAKESKLKALFLFAGILAFWTIARKTIMPFIDDAVIPILHIRRFYLLSDSELINFFLIIFFASTTLFISFFLAKYIYDRVKSFPCLTLAVVSAYYIIYSYEWWQHKVNLSWGQSFDWVDVFNLALLVFVIAWASCTNQLYKFLFKMKDYLCNHKEEYYVKHNLKSDEPVEDEQDDRLNYKKLAEELVEKLNNTLPFQSISIAINGAWGVGKTSFVKLLKKELDRVMEDEHKHIILEFNPRLSKAKETIQEDFFALLFSELAKYNSSFYTIGANYLKAIDVASQGFWWLGFLSFFKTGNRNKEWLKINEAVRSTNKHIFIFIDDLDRLVGDEILEVFKIIGGNANFDNITFIVAFDKDYVHLNLNKIIRNSRDYRRSYSDKFFTGEYHLDRLSRSQIESLFIEFFVKDKYDTKKGRRICSQVFSGISEEVLVKYFKTIRDIKRFITFVELELSLQSLERMLSILVPREVFLMFLLKFKAPSTYDSLYDMEYFGVLGKFLLRADLNKESILCYDILQELFEEEDFGKDNDDLMYSFTNLARSAYSISKDNGRWFYSYFVTRDKGSKYHINNRIGVPDIESLLQDENYQSKFEDLISKDEKGKELPKDKQDKLWDIVDALSFDQYRRKWQRDYLKPYSYLIIFLHSILGVYNLVNYLKELIEDKKQKTPNGYKNFLLKIIKEFNEIDHNNRYAILEYILVEFARKNWIEDSLILNQEECLKLAKNSLIETLKRDKIYKHQKHYKMLISCIKEKSSEGEFILDEKVCQKVKDIVVQSPEDFAKNLIVFNGESLQFRLYFKDVFEGEDKLIEYFKNKYNGRLKTRILNFITLYEANNKEPIELGGVEEREGLGFKMSQEGYNFNEEIKGLEKAKEIRRLFDNNLIESEEDMVNYKRELSKMLHKLSIRFIWDTLSPIQNEVNKFQN